MNYSPKTQKEKLKTNKKVVISQPRFFPHISYLDKIAQADLFIVSDDLPVKKNLYEIRNKFFCVLSKKPQYLHIPIKEVKPFNQVELANTDFPAKLRKILHDSYKKYPFYDKEILEYTLPDIEDDQFNLMMSYWYTHIYRLCSILGIVLRMERASEANSQRKKTERLKDILDYFEADVYLSGIAGADYLDKNIVTLPIEYHQTYGENMKYREGDDTFYMIYDMIFTIGLEETKKRLNYGKH